MNFSDTTFFNAPHRKRRAGKRVTPATQPVVPLALVSATYDAGAASVMLTFNQDINIEAMVLSVIVVTDATYTGELLAGATVIAQTANSVTVELTVIESTFGSGVTLSVDVGNGIFPASGGDEWEGVSGVALPFPS